MREQIYALEPNFLVAYLERIENATEEELRIAAQAFPFGDDEDDDEDLDGILSLDGDVAHIKIVGPLSARGPSPIARLFGFGGTSYPSIIKALDAAENNPACASLVLDMDTPGGDVAGCDEVWQRIDALTKPCIAINHALVGSAGYYLASACDHIYGTSPGVETGSIGCLIAGWDESKAEEASGMRYVRIISRNAPKKGADLETKAGRDVLQERVDALESVFMSRVAQGRHTTIDNVIANYGKGSVLIAKDPRGGADAISVGMLDGLVSPFPSKPAATLGAAPPLAGADAQHDAPHSPVPDPAPNAGSDNQEVQMNLSEFLATNPDARAAYENDLAKAKLDGATAAKANLARVGVVLASDTYSANKIVRAKALAVLEGKASMEALESVVTMADMLAEQTAGAAAQDEQPKKETPGQQQKPKLTAADLAKLSAEDVAKLTAADLEGATPEMLQIIERIQLGLPALEAKE